MVEYCLNTALLATKPAILLQHNIRDNDMKYLLRTKKRGKEVPVSKMRLAHFFNGYETACKRVNTGGLDIENYTESGSRYSLPICKDCLRENQQYTGQRDE